MTRAFTRAITSLFALAALAVAAPMTTAAQEQMPVEPVENLQDAELETFAVAYIEIMRISQEAEASLATVQDPEAAQAIQVDAQQRMEAVLREHEMETDRYRRIGLTINQDPELAERFVAVVEDMQGGGEGAH